ncbi:MAG: [protein-PII] uridylyltransferase [Sandaracinus sp.]
MADGAARPDLDLTALAPMLGAVCQEYRDRHRSSLEGRLRAGEGGLPVATLHARIVDGMLSALYCAAEATLRTRGEMMRLALVAVGGYGRGHLGLHSDLDLIVLAEREDDVRAAKVAEALLYPLWDLGLEIGHAVRGVESTLQLAREDLRTATMLLDARRVAGDASLVDELLRGARRQVFDPGGTELVQKLIDERLARHERFGGSRYLLEPDVKHGCGGLRDLDLVLWAMQIRKGVRTTDEAVRASLLVSREADALAAAQSALWTIRQQLHLRAGRRQDRLTFEDQEEVAARLGYVDEASPGAAAGQLGVERFMQSYYRHARAIEQVGERVLEAAVEPERRERARSDDNGDGTLVFDGRITLKDSERLGSDPALALRLYRQVMRRGLPAYGFARETIARVAADAAWCAALRESPEAKEIFLELLSTSAEAPARPSSTTSGSILGELHEVGLLLAMLPEFEPVTGRVQHDVYHVYTVDVHSIAAVDRLRAVLRGDEAEPLPLATQLASEAPSRVALFVGVLLHDVGKGRGRDHSVIGAELALPAARRLGLSEEDARHVEWLVRDHLRLYHWAMRRDTSDPSTLREVVEAIGTVERLRDLYLLTLVDLGTTSPTALSSWKARMLDDLFLAARGAIEAAASGTTPPSRAEQLRAAARERYAGEPATLAFVAGMPDRYLLTHGVGLAAEHAAIAGARRGPVHVAAMRASNGVEGEGELVVVTDDRPGLLADIAAVLAGSRLAVQSAHIYTRAGASGAEAFDVFHVRHPGSVDGDPVDPATLARVSRDLEGLLGGKIALADVLARRTAAPSWAERKRPDVRTEILVDNEVSPRFTVVDVFTRDRFGLLHAIARALHEAGISIALSKVSTEGERVADVFYVTDARGAKLGAEAVESVRASLTRAIEQLAAA